MGAVTRRRLIGAVLAGGAGLAFALTRGRSRGRGLAAQATVVFRGVALFDGVRFADGPRDVLVRGGMVEQVGARLGTQQGAEERKGGALFPGFVDAHVHLSFSDALHVARGGVTGVLDLGAPPDYAFAAHLPLRYRSAGPLLTAPGGYPTRSWGAGGYGLEVADAGAAREAVATVAGRGASVIKLAVEPREGPVLPEPVLEAAVGEAHERGLKVAAHALDAASVRAALAAGVDVLAHAPLERLPAEVVSGLGERHAGVISTVRAFGDSEAARLNLAALVEAGCRVYYGTDLGNGSIRPGIDAAELEIIAGATGGRDAALRAATSDSGTLAEAGGKVVQGLAADLVWVPAFAGLGDLAGRKEVWIAGRPVR